MTTTPSVHRRRLFASALAGAGAWFASKTVAKAAPMVSNRAKVVYHVSDRDKVSFALGNIRNHFDGMGGPDKVTIALVVHGPALKLFQRDAADPDVTKRMADFVAAGLAPAACIHSMKAQNVTLTDLLPGFVVAERGGVVRIAELQSQGYVYLKP